MGLFDRWRNPTPTPSGEPAEDQQRFLRVLRADGQRIDLTSRDTGPRLTAIRAGQEWQTDAWTYRDLIGELRYSQRLLARSVAKVRFYAAELREHPDDPAELSGDEHDLDAQLAADAVENLARLPLDDDPDGFLAVFTENLETVGEAWIHGQQDDSGEQWNIRSVSEIISAGDRIMLAELPNSTALGQRPIDPEREELLRCWIRHPRWGQLADSPLRAMLDLLEEIVLTGREMRAAARSRIASNGILLVPNSLSLLRTREDDEDLAEQGVTEDEFMADFVAAMLAPIRNEGDAGSVVPLVLRGDPEALKEVRHLTLTRADAEKLMERLQGSVLRMLQGLDIQPEQVTGLGPTNHWSGWQIEATNVRHQVLPMAFTLAGCLTKAYLRPALEALGHDPQQLRRVVVWCDPTPLVESPDRSQDARDAWDRDTISDTTLRDALGFDDDDKPDPHEHLARLLTKGRLTPEAVPLVAALSGLDMSDPKLRSALAISVGLNTKAQEALGPASRALPAGQSTANPAQPGQVVPEQTAPAPPSQAAPASVTAAAADPALPTGWRVDVDTARALAAIDAALLDRILTASDAAIARVIERAGGKARNAVRKDEALAASLVGVDAALVAGVIGREKLAEFASIPDLLAETYDRLRGQVTGWLTQAAEAAADLTVRLLGLDPRGPLAVKVRGAVTSRLAVHRDAAWTALAETLDAAADRALFTADPLTPEPARRGEDSSSLIRPAEVARALTIAGGGQPGGAGGMGTGPVLQEVITQEGAVRLGHEWQYHPERPRGAHFPPHMGLDGLRFGTWTDPKLDTDERTAWIGPYFHPQDHPGCRCGSSILYATPELDDGIVERRLREAAQSLHGRTATRVAAEDTAAGRIGTSLQNEVEVRDRITADVQRLRQHYIEGASR